MLIKRIGEKNFFTVSSFPVSCKKIITALNADYQMKSQSRENFCACFYEQCIFQTQVIDGSQSRDLFLDIKLVKYVESVE